MPLINGVDFSQWGGELRQSTIECWKANGIRHAVVQYSHLMNQHLDALIAASWQNIEAYVYLYWHDPYYGTPQERTRRALQVAGNRISFLWLDAEDSESPFDEDALAECVEICNDAGMPCGIYTGRWWWISNGNNSTRFSYLPLWDAYYKGDGDIPQWDNKPDDMSGFRPYGGWTSARIWQWHNSTHLCGHSVDLNVMEFADAIVEPESEDEGEEDMYIVSKTNTGHTDHYKSYLVRGLVYRHIPNTETFMSLAAMEDHQGGHLQLYEPDANAWEIMTQDAKIIEEEGAR